MEQTHQISFMKFICTYFHLYTKIVIHLEWGLDYIKKNPLLIIMKPKFKLKDIIINTSDKRIDYGVILGIKKVNKLHILGVISDIHMYKVKFMMRNSTISLTKWIDEGSLKLHPELQFGNKLCNICHTGRIKGWEYGVPKCKPVCEFEPSNDEELEDDFEEDDEIFDPDLDNGLIKCGVCGKEYNCISYAFCPYCFNDNYKQNKIDDFVDETISSIDDDLETHKYNYLSSYYSLRNLKDYRKTQLLALKVRRLILNEFKRFGKLNIKETTSRIVYRQSFIKEGTNYSLWGEIDRIIIKETEQILKERITLHSVKKDGRHELYDGFSLLTTPNENETEYQLDGPTIRLALLKGMKKDEKTKENTPYYIG